MYLKNLTLRGFKSFASSTTLRFEPGITAVVGPNGSGKSNVVDALAWVMGEQGAKSLRGGKMEDVIFAGTASRAPLGRAEVVLTIDNSDGALPIDYTEVTISRLMFRSGSSEYAINGDSCRLLDIQELLSDSGIGREMHVIIGQGQLDRVLHSGPDGRRAVIEEAAGVLKHRKRKEKALRKLDAMQGNLTRVQDLTGELRRQLKPLGRQAEIARRAAVIQADLRDARLRLLADDLVTLRTRLEQEAADEAAVRERRADTERALAGAQRREAELEAAEAEQAPRLALVQDTWFRMSALRERLRGVADLAAEKHRNAAEALEAAAGEERRRGRDPEDMEREAAEIREQEETLREALDEAGEGLAAAVAERTAAEDALGAEERRLQAAARAAADRREELARLRGRVEALRSKAQAGRAEIGRLGAARDEAEQRAAAARGAFEEFEAEVVEDPALAADHEAAQEALAAAKDAAERARAAVDGPRGALAAARTAVTSARSADQDAQQRVTALRARIEALNLTLASAADGGEALLTAGAAGTLPGVLGTVASLLTVRPGYETAVAAALGDAAEAVAVGSLGTAEAALTLLRTEDAGRAGLLVGGGPAVVPAGAPARVAGVDYAADAVTVPPEVRAALEHLLRDVAVVADVPAAVALVRREPSLRAVTRDGELVGAHWARGGGAVGGQSLLEMRAALDEATAGLAAAEATAGTAAEELAAALAAEQAAQAALDAAQAGVTDAQAVVNQAQADLDRVRGRVREFDARAAQEARRAARLEADVRAARGEAERLARALAAADASVAGDLAAAEELALRLAEAEEAAEVAGEAGDDTGARDELAARCRELRAAEMEARLTVRTAEERVQAIAGRADALERGARREREERAHAARRRAQRRQEAAVAEAVLRGARTALERIALSLAEAVRRREAAETARAAREAELKVVRGHVRELSGTLERLVNVVHGNEVARAEQRLRLEQLEQRALEEFGLEVESLVAEYGPDQPVPPGPEAAEDARPAPYERTVQEKRARAAERQLNQLGKVNPLALEEFAALEERHAFLTSQLEDLKKTQRELLGLVKEVDERVQQVFAAAYADTAREFERIFARLFPGGEGSLSLTEPADMLVTGVEVAARPPGKKVKRLSLLSGGERSLVAIAFLVAVFKARPSPFYVLDEVEAALDDTNTQRLITVFEELRESSQLIVITHQKRTMEGADALYGVSMRGDGVTQVVSQRLREPEPA